MNEPLLVGLSFAAFVVFLVAIYAMVSKQRRRIDEHLRNFAARSGWYDVRSQTFLGQGLIGSWNGFPVQVRYIPRHKSVPERVDIRVGLSAPVRMIVKRRFPGLMSNRPISLFGPPLVPLPREDVWVRADERSFADRLLAMKSVAEPLAALIDRYDEVRVGSKGIRVVRAVDGSAATVSFGKNASFGMRRFDPQALNRELTNAWTLAQGLAGAATH